LIQLSLAIINIESKGGEAVEGVGTSGFEMAFMVELSIDEGDMKASEVEDFGHL
jgi:hypothetical protein